MSCFLHLRLLLGTALSITLASAQITLGGAPCYDGYLYNGNTYTGCTSLDSWSGAEWCGIVSYVPNTGFAFGTWGYCDSAPNACKVKTRAHSQYPEMVLEGDLTGDYCVFPFRYQGNLYDECATSRVGENGDTDTMVWCSERSNLGANSKRWGYCDAPLVQGPQGNRKQCVFPFTYRSIIYYTCTSIGNNGIAWCSVDAIYASNWVNCNPITDSCK